MPVNEPSKAYAETLEQVTRVRDCSAGSDAIKAKGNLYLPQLGGQSDTDYKAYKQRGYLMPVVRPTATALTGAIMRKAPVHDFPEARLEALVDNADGFGKALSLIATTACMELFEAGRYGLLGEVTETGLAIHTYSREAIINWSPEYIVLTQNYTVTDDKDKFKKTTKTEYLELTFDENGLYIQNIWREVTGKKGFAIIKTNEPKINGTRFNKLPFEFINTTDASVTLTPPALLHLADINLDQYRLSTDFRPRSPGIISKAIKLKLCLAPYLARTLLLYKINSLNSTGLPMFHALKAPESIIMLQLTPMASALSKYSKTSLGYANVQSR